MPKPMIDELSQPKGLSTHLSDVQIVDVREPYEWDAGRIDGSVHLPLNDLMGGAGDDDLDRERPVVVVCRVGNRSELAAIMLEARGYDAHNLEGGLEAWERDGLPLTMPNGAPGHVV
jgi:rhodanese-related sulfurtransferase